MKHRRLILLSGALVLLAGIVLGLWRWSSLPPTWYQPPDPHDQRVQMLAERVEYRLVEELQKIRPPRDNWTLRIRDEYLNMWLAARLPQWIEHDSALEWPPQLGTPQLRFESAGISAAVPLQVGRSRRMLVVRVWPTINADGELCVRLDRVAMGRISVAGEPFAALAATLSGAAPSVMEQAHVQETLKVLQGDRAISPIINLADGRRVRLVELRLGDGDVDLTFETLDDVQASP